MLHYWLWQCSETCILWQAIIIGKQQNYIYIGWVHRCMANKPACTPLVTPLVKTSARRQDPASRAEKVRSGDNNIMYSLKTTNTYNIACMISYRSIASMRASQPIGTSSSLRLKHPDLSLSRLRIDFRLIQLLIWGICTSYEKLTMSSVAA